MVNPNFISLLMDSKPSVAAHPQHADSVHTMDLSPVYSMQQLAKAERSLYLAKLLNK